MKCVGHDHGFCGIEMFRNAKKHYIKDILQLKKSTMPESVGIIGLGRVGLEAAKAYLRDGFEVLGCDISPIALKAFRSAGGVALRTPREIARRASVIMVMVLDDAQVIEVVHGENGILSEVKNGATVICMSTIHQHTIESVSKRCREKNTAFVDCPFTGGPARIPSRTLTLIAAAPEELLERVRPILEVIGNIIYAGPTPGMGQAIKHCNQLLVGVTQAATMEVITLARKLGIDPALVATVVGSGIAGSDYFRLLSDSVINKKPSPGGLGQMCKDMAIVESTLRNNGMKASVAIAASAYFSEALNMGMSKGEGGDLIHVVEKLSDTTHPEA